MNKIKSRMISVVVVLLLTAYCLLPTVSHAADVTDIMKKSQLAFLYPGKDMKARVYMRLINKDGKERIKEMTMLRKNYQEGGDQKYFIYFYQPADVRDMTFMVYKYAVKDDDRWIFMPALNMVRRIAANDKRSSFVGSDFTYEDVSGRDIKDDNHSITKEEKLGDKDAYIIKGEPKDEKGADFSYKLSWIDKGNFLPLKEEYYDKRGELYKVFTADEVKDVQGFPVITKRTMKDVKSEHRTEVQYQKTEFNIGLDDDVFTERYLKKPLKKWIE
ncbi:MAG: outer membrane lipoprotein-sorting protein [Deltaproteobacteria bacterium]|nr:outer membrane lipoprotein-sorting protein [Deltaproteobacteria bacterium]